MWFRSSIVSASLLALLLGAAGAAAQPDSCVIWDDGGGPDPLMELSYTGPPDELVYGTLLRFSNGVPALGSRVNDVASVVVDNIGNLNGWMAVFVVDFNTSTFSVLSYDQGSNDYDPPAVFFGVKDQLFTVTPGPCAT